MGWFNFKKKENGVKKFHYESGQLRKEIVYKEGEIILYTTFYENGQMESRVNLKNGPKDGSCEVFYSNGQLESDIMYESDIPVDGPYTIFFENGHIKEKGVFSNNGEIIKLLIRDGQPVQQEIEYDKDMNQLLDSDKSLND